MDSRKRKGIIGGVTIFLAATMFIGGTLAWTDFTQSRTNRFRGSVYYDATLHDDFDGENKDVYVENSGENTIYVRVRLDEYMQIGNVNMNGENVLEDGAVTALDKDKWLIHKYGQDVPNGTHLDCGAVAGDDKISFHKYYQWNMSGRQIWYDPGTPGVVSSVLDGQKTDADGNVVTDAYGIPIPIVDDKETTGGTVQTLEATTPISMGDYDALLLLATDPSITLEPDAQAMWDDVQKGCWILDTDGWAYWSQPLEPGQATNLLLDEVKLVDKEPTDDWYYAIDVKLQAVSLNETKTTWQTAGDYTAEAANLIDSWHAE